MEGRHFGEADASLWHGLTVPVEEEIRGEFAKVSWGQFVGCPERQAEAPGQLPVGFWSCHITGRKHMVPHSGSPTSPKVCLHHCL